MSEEEPKSRGRSPGFVMSQEHRDKIRNSNILRYLIDHVEGSRNMEPSQVTAGLGLLKKVMPDLQSTSLTGGEEGDEPVQIIVTGVPRASD